MFLKPFLLAKSAIYSTKIFKNVKYVLFDIYCVYIMYILIYLKCSLLNYFEQICFSHTILQKSF